jgi:peptidoglycan-N-acetylglucosamine deacetylase
MTFDDGPDPVWTPRLLDLLGAFDAQATFFLIAGRAAAQPELIARMREHGHGIGLHCDQHVRHNERDIEWVRHDTRSALGQLAALDILPVYWRTPWGDTAPWSSQVAREHGLQLIGWTVDTCDWRGDKAAAMFATTRDALEDGAIVLAHDGLGPGAQREGALETLAYVELVARHARGKGLALKPLA